ncbi:hypothetical protein OSJ57_22470 [Sphingomonas sp. HH69]
MIYDVPFRHQQALDPSSLTTIAATLHALTRGIEDCRNAGVDPEYDPAIALLAQHFATVTANAAPEAALRSACSRRIEELDRFPALLALSLRGVAHDRTAKERFHIDARKAMRSLAKALMIAEPDYKVTSHPGDPAIAGDIVLSTADFEVSMSIGPLHEGYEVRYHARRGPAASERLRFASIRDFVKTQRFATRLRRDLRLDDLPTVAPGHAPRRMAERVAA